MTHLFALPTWLTILAFVLRPQHWSAEGLKATTPDHAHGNRTGPPDVFLLGVAKAGTTALHEYLTQQAHVCGGVAKEYHYWAFRHENEHTYREYSQNFHKCQSDQLTIDGSPSNEGPRAMEGVFKTFSLQSFQQKKFIFILREPIDRMISWYNFMRAKASQPCTHNTAENCAIFRKDMTHLDSMPEYFQFYPYFGVRAGSYMLTLANLLYDKHYGHDFMKHPLIPRHHMLIVNFDTLMYNASDTLDRLTSFLSTSAKNFVLPFVNGVDYELKKSGLEKVDMNCSDYLYYKAIFENKNKGLTGFINNHPDKPVEEPHFPEFIDKNARRCN